MVCLAAAAVGLVLVASLNDMEGKWLIALPAVLLFWGAVFLSGRVERFLLGCLFLALPLNADFQILPPVTAWQGVDLPKGVPQMGLSIIDLLLMVLYFLWIGQLLKARRREILWPAGASLALGLILWGGVSMLNAQSMRLGFYLLFNYVKAFLLFFYVANRIKTREDFLLVARCLALGMILEGFIVFAQHLHGGNLGLDALGERKVEKEVEMVSGTLFRPGGTLGHPNELGGYLASVLPILLALVLTPVRRAKGSLLFMAAFGIGCVSLILSLSRSAWLTGGLSCLGLLIWAAVRQKGKFDWRPVLGLSFLGLLATLLFAPLVIARWGEDDKGSTYSRIPQSEMALEVVRQHPFLGVGLNNFTVSSYLYETYVVDPKTRGRVYGVPGRVHDVFLQMAAEIGLIGLAWFALFMVWAVRKGRLRIHRCSEEQVRWILMGVFCGLLARLFHDAVHTGDVAMTHQLWIYPGLLAAGAWVSRSAPGKLSARGGAG